MRSSFVIMRYGALVAVLALTACGGSSSDSPTVPNSSAATISILGQFGTQSFSPNPATGGQSVVWRNNDGVTHRILANDGVFDTGDIAPGATSVVVRPPGGGLNYHCSIHPTTMFGAIGDESGGAPPTCVGDYCCC